MSLRELLDNQFQATQEYCNARTALRNALIRDDSSSKDNSFSTVEGDGMESVTLQYQRAVQKLRMALQRLEEEHRRMQEQVENDTDGRSNQRVVVALLTRHMERSERIVHSISSTPVMHPNGIPYMQTVSVDEMTLALSTLRASIRTLTDVL
jgi:phage/plasmid primase-like uncharacterized protein